MNHIITITPPHYSFAQFAMMVISSMMMTKGSVWR